jgi:type II secretory pathway pseudopilin PulG
MSLPVLVAIVVVGIALCVVAVHFTGGSRQAALEAAEDAARRFGEDFPDEAIRAIRLTSDKRTAFLELDGKRTGIVQAVGDRFLTRIFTPQDISAVTAEPGVVSIRFRDFTWAGGRFAFADADDAGKVIQALQPTAAESTLGA